MCTVTFWPRKRGYILGMNRDEQRARPHGLPPEEFRVSGRRVFHPREPSGGTWIAANETGTAFALINWYSIASRVHGEAVSRGQVVLALRDVDSPEEAASRLGTLPLSSMNPFRLIGFFKSQAVVSEWRWNRDELLTVRHEWEPAQWASSGYDEPSAQRIRSEAFCAARRESDAGSVAWLRRLHSSHGGEPGPFSTCMHRPDAVTVSYTEVQDSDEGIAMRGTSQAPCECPLHAGGVD